MRQRTLPLIMVAGAVAACSSGHAWTGNVRDSAGIRIVENTSEGIWEPGEAWRLEEDLRIGSVEGDAEYQFGQVSPQILAIATDSRGQIYVVDMLSQDIRVFDETGTYLRTIGRPGSGPGELSQSVAVVLIGLGDTLLVPDMQNLRINRYLPDGTSLGSVPISVERGLPFQYRVTPSRTIVTQMRQLGLPGMPAPDSTDAIVVLEPSGEVGDTIMRIPSGQTLNLGGASPEITVFAPEPLWDVTPGLGVTYAFNDLYRISQFDQDGRLVRIITMPYAQTPVSEHDRRVITDFLERQWRDAGVPAEAMPQLRSMVKFGEMLPAFAQILSGPDSTIWVQHQRSLADATEEELQQFNLLEESGAPDWDVFDAEGRYLGIVTMPPRFQPRLLVGDRFYGVARDELDVPYIVRLNIIRND